MPVAAALTKTGQLDYKVTLQNYYNVVPLHHLDLQVLLEP